MVWQIAAAAFVVAAGSKVAESRQRQKAERRQRQADRAQRQGEQVRAQRERQRLLAQLRVANAEQIAQAENQGISSSSSLGTALGSSTSQAAGNISYVTTLSGFNLLASRRRTQANSALNRASQYRALGEVAQQAGQTAMGQA